MAEKAPKTDAVSKPQPHNFKGLRDMLFDELNLLRGGRISVARARTTSQLARRIIEASTLDLYARQKLGEGSPAELKRLMQDNVQG